MKIEKEPAKLCDCCIHLFEVIESQEKNWVDPFHDGEAVMKRSKDANCSICSTLWKEPTNSWESKQFEGIDRVFITRAGGYIDLRFESSTGRGMPVATHFREFVLCRVEDDESLLRGFQEEMLEDGNEGEASLGLAARLLERCVGSHVDCVSDRQPSTYPSRLLDLRYDTVRLIDTRKIQVSGPYVTLSHTWGKAHIKILTHQTLPDFQAGFGMDEIPATFRDTIKVVRQLNLRYLWIDCYCIIQDDDAKLMEIAKMGEVYSNAILNIGAASAKGPRDGLFSSRALTCACHRPMTIDFSAHSQLESSTYLLYPTSCVGRNHGSLFSHEESSISSRAWCMQERFLCPRMLHFWKYGIFWECHSMYSGSERLPTQAFPVEQATGYTPFSPRTGSEVSVTDHLEDWDQIAATYSTMALSWPNVDKLAACGGVAKVMAELVGGEYMAGHFRQDLIPSLAWKVSRHQQSEGMTTQRSNVWRAPSWSWTSMDGAVSIDRDDDDDTEEEPKMRVVKWEKLQKRSADLDESEDSEPAREIKRVTEDLLVGSCAQLISVKIELVDASNPYGALKSAAITIKGPVTEVEYDATPNANRQKWQSCIRWGDNQVIVRLDDPSEPRRNLAIVLICIRRGRMYSESLRYAGPTVRGSGPLLSGLVLSLFQKGLHGNPDVYNRVGAFKGKYFRDSQKASRFDQPKFQRPGDRMIIVV